MALHSWDDTVKSVYMLRKYGVRRLRCIEDYVDASSIQGFEENIKKKEDLLLQRQNEDKYKNKI